MAIKDYKEINIRYQGHPKFLSTKVIEDNIIEVIIQKLEMILFTRKGSVIGDSDFGCDIEFYLWQTRVPANIIKKNIQDQIIKYIPELTSMEYTITIDLYNGTLRDIMYVNVIIKDFSVNFIFQ
jgi:phage baseplate assembly protein W